MADPKIIALLGAFSSSTVMLVLQRQNIFNLMNQCIESYMFFYYKKVEDGSIDSLTTAVRQPSLPNSSHDSCFVAMSRDSCSMMYSYSMHDVIQHAMTAVYMTFVLTAQQPHQTWQLQCKAVMKPARQLQRYDSHQAARQPCSSHNSSITAIIAIIWQL